MTEQQLAIYGNARCEIFSFHNGTETAEHHVMIHVNAQGLAFAQQLEAVASAYEQLLDDKFGSCTAVLKRYFVSDSANQEAAIAKREKGSGAGCALSIIEQPPLDGTKIALWVYLMDNVRAQETASGLYEVSHSGYRHLWKTRAHTFAANSEFQTRQLLSEYSEQLQQEGCSLADNCLRTWFFVNDIDLNYGGVVRARNQIFFTHGLTTSTHFIASTGIGGRQSDPNALVQMDAYAIAGIRQEQIRYLYASSNMNRTSEYGVSFERGTAVDYADRRHVLVSGTASIDNKGKVAHTGDIAGQTLRMWDNVETLLKEAECTFDDVAHIIVYLRDIADYQVVRDMFDKRFSGKPYVIVQAPVCRPAWLIEMECMAVKDICRPEFGAF